MKSTSVLHPITRLIIGGAQENTMLTADLLNKAQDEFAARLKETPPVSLIPLGVKPPLNP